jgi:hypothetical protein
MAFWNVCLGISIELLREQKNKKWNETHEQDFATWMASTLSCQVHKNDSPFTESPTS